MPLNSISWPMFHRQFLISEIQRLKQEKNITLLAHYYQEDSVQQVADFVGDSLALAVKARQAEASIILFAGVHFMAQTAKILNPACKVLLPDMAAGCSLADSCPPDKFKEFIDNYPDHVVISYINCAAEIKAMSDIICTSSNAEKIIGSVPPNRPIIFAPDKNLGNYLIEQTGREMVLWDGACMVHEAFSIEKLLKLHRQYPDAKIIAHPESESHLLKVAHYIGSTNGMMHFVKKDPSAQFIIATEAGILHAMSREAPDKLLIPAPPRQDNTCACSECAFMKLNTLEKVYQCIIDEYPVIDLVESLRLSALKPVLKMLELSPN